MMLEPEGETVTGRTMRLLREEWQAEAYQRGQAEERAAVVADLRAYTPFRAICSLLADRYERGEHRG